MRIQSPSDLSHEERNHVSDNLFSHPVFSHPAEAEHVVTTTETSAAPVQHPVFSDRDR